MARTIRDKPGLHHDLLTRFVISRRPLQTVAYEELRPSTYTKAYNSTAFVLHGFLGSARTWRSFSRTLLSNLSSPSGWRMVLVDLRNRGRSAEIGGNRLFLDSHASAIFSLKLFTCLPVFSPGSSSSRACLYFHQVEGLTSTRQEMDNKVAEDPSSGTTNPDA
ncbi:PREDICTED: ABHD11 [Prunus dulcis]|uniref:PREDICTED: ABHD11 n=1 Tax=Prunus dulcis TaxID=3755 RepID=A0A5E4FSB5_PRUDU|nr:PREDICTED: ABHD11 [Prunus dulcis]